MTSRSMHFGRAFAAAMIGAAIAATGFTAPSRADDYPTRPITILVPFPAGGIG